MIQDKLIQLIESKKGSDALRNKMYYLNVALSDLPSILNALVQYFCAFLSFHTVNLTIPTLLSIVK